LVEEKYFCYKQENKLFTNNGSNQLLFMILILILYHYQNIKSINQVLILILKLTYYYLNHNQLNHPHLYLILNYQKLLI